MSDLARELRREAEQLREAKREATSRDERLRLEGRIAGYHAAADRVEAALED